MIKFIMTRLHTRLSEKLDWYRKWHDHSGHLPFHWGAFIFASILSVSLIVGEIDRTYSEYPQIQRAAASSHGDPHGYFNQLVARPDHWKSYSFRDQAQLGATNRWVTYNPAGDSDPNRQDAAKVVIPAFSTWMTDVLARDVGPDDLEIWLSDANGNVTRVSTSYNVRGATIKIGDEYVRAIGGGSGSPYPLNRTTGRYQLAQRGALGSTPQAHPAGTRVQRASNSLASQVRVPLNTQDGNTYLFTWDGYWTDSYVRSGLSNHKAFQFSTGGQNIWLEPQTSFGSSAINRDIHVASVGHARYYGGLAGGADWATQNNGRQAGPGVAGVEPLAPRISPVFPLHPNRWTRWWVRIEQRANDYDYLDMWIADEVNDPVQVYNRLPISVPPAHGTIDRFWLEFNTSTDTYRGDLRDLVAYVRNFAALVNPPSDITPLLQRPGAGGTLPPYVPPPAPPTPPPVTPPVTPPTAPPPAPTPTNATVSPWSDWSATGNWSACTNGTQTRTEQRTRTVVTPATNGGITPSLTETRTVSQNCTVPDTQPPTVSLTAPTLGTTVSGTVNITANATDNVGVTGVQFKLDGVNLGAEDTASPYSIQWNTTQTSNGTKILTATARDQAGNTRTSSPVSITVNNIVTTLPAETSPPSTPANLSATSPSPTRINLTWSSSANAAGYSIYRNNTEIATSITTTSYQDTNLSPSTSYSYQVLSYDTAGNRSSRSSSASATTESLPVPTPPPAPIPTPTPTPAPIISVPIPPSTRPTIPVSPPRTPATTPTVTRDEVSPTIHSFSLEQGESPTEVTVSFSASDQGGSHLWRAYLFRARYEEGCDESNKTLCNWTAIENASAPESSDDWTDTLTHRLSSGTYWYSFQVMDRQGNLGYDDDPVKVTVPESTLRELISRILLTLRGWWGR